MASFEERRKQLGVKGSESGLSSKIEARRKQLNAPSVEAETKRASDIIREARNQPRVESSEPIRTTTPRRDAIADILGGYEKPPKEIGFAPLRVDQKKKFNDDLKAKNAEKSRITKETSLASTNATKKAEAAKPTYRERVMANVERQNWPEILKPVGTAISAISEIPFSRAVQQRTTMYPERQDPNDRVGGLAGLATDIAIPLTIPNAGLSGTQLYNTAGNMLQRAVPKLADSLKGRIASEAIKGGVTGSPLSVGATLAVNPDASNKELLQSAAYGAGGGALLGSAMPVIGKAFTSFVNRGKTVAPEVEQQIGEMLALPAPRPRGNANQAQTPDVIFGEGKVEPLGLPSGNPVQRTRYTVAGNNQALNRVMTDIKPEVDAIITPPTRRDLLIDYIQRNLEIPREEIWNMPIKDLQELGSNIRQNMDIPKIAIDVARRRGHDLPALLDGNKPSVGQKVAQNAQERAYGVYPDELPNVRTPQFTRQTTNDLAMPVERVGRAPASNVAPTTTTRSSAPNVRPVRPVTGVNPSEPPLRMSDLRTNSEPIVANPVITTRNAVPPTQQRGFAQTLVESDKTPPGFKDRLRTAYTPITNEQTVASANKRITKDIEEATSFALGGSRFTAEKATVAQRLIDHYNSVGNYERAVDIAEKVSEEATRAGQSIQALSLFDKLTPEGVIIRAQRIATKTNENLPVWNKDVKVTPQMAENIHGLAQATQRLTGVKSLSNDVINILDRAKAGEKLTATETQMLKRFVSESKQFIKDVSKKTEKAPRAPKQSNDVRVRDHLTAFLSAQEEAAKARIKARGNQASSTPLDVWADYAIIGASKMGKGAIKFSEWSEQMVKDLGEDVRPLLKNLYQRSRETFESSNKKITTQTISEAERLTEKLIKAKELSPGEAITLRRLAQNVSRLSGEEKAVASQDLQIVLQALEKPSILKKISTAQTIGQLLNPKTQVRNSLGNELFYRLERLNKLVSTPIDIARSKLTGGERTVTLRTNNQGEYWKNWMRGLKAGWKGTNVNGIETQYDLGSPAFRSKYNPLKYMEKALGASLKSFDTAAYMRAYNNTIGEQATLRAINEGQRGNKELIQKYIREADDNIMKIADEYGKYVTFQDNNLISKGLVALKRGLNVGKEFGIGDLVLKYPKTPGALLHRAMEYSPAGFVRSAYILTKPLLKKGSEANTAEVTQALSRAIIGTVGLTGMGYFLLKNNVLTAAASKDKDIRDLQKQAGQGQYQVNLSALMRLVKSGFNPDEAKIKEGDQLLTYDWMQPLAMSLSIGANTAKNQNAGKQKFSGVLGSAYNSIEGGLGTLTEQSVLSGIKSAAEGYPGQTVTDKILDVLSDLPSSFVPTFSNQIKQLTDNSKPETYSPNKLEQAWNRAKAKVPGSASGNLPKQFDTLGNEKENYQDNSIFNVLFNPSFSSKYELTPEAQYIVDLINETGDESLAPRVPGKSVTIDGQTIKLNGDMFSRLQQIQGEATKAGLQGRISKDAGKSLERRSENISKLLTTVSGDAKKKLIKETGLK